MTETMAMQETGEIRNLLDSLFLPSPAGEAGPPRDLNGVEIRGYRNGVRFLVKEPCAPSPLLKPGLTPEGEISHLLDLAPKQIVKASIIDWVVKDLLTTEGPGDPAMCDWGRLLSIMEKAGLPAIEGENEMVVTLTKKGERDRHLSVTAEGGFWRISIRFRLLKLSPDEYRPTAEHLLQRLNTEHLFSFSLDEKRRDVVASGFLPGRCVSMEDQVACARFLCGNLPILADRYHFPLMALGEKKLVRAASAVFSGKGGKSNGNGRKD